MSSNDYERRAIEAEKKLAELTQRVAFLESLRDLPKNEPKKEVKEAPKKEAPKKEAPKEAPKKDSKKEAPKKETPKGESKKEAPKEDSKKDENSLEHLVHLQALQGDKIREMKKNGASKEDVQREVAILNDLKKKVEQKTKESSDKLEFPRAAFTQLMTQRFFIAPSFEIYGGVAGLYDLGPAACAIKANILHLWRHHFIIQENMLEIDCSSVTPYQVLKTSGHVAKFTDLMVKDVKTGNCFRADHLLEHVLEVKLADKTFTDPAKRKELELIIAQADNYDAKTMAQIYKQFNIKAPETANDLTDPEPFNLMFSTSIGPSGTSPGFLRPETAQGIFVNFNRLLEYNAKKLPFAGAQIGQAFRNEIAPRSGLLRVREFTLAEIEHFVNPEDKSHPKFDSVKNLVLNLYPRDAQTTTLKTVKMSLGEAVDKKIIDNQTLAYFIGRTHLFLLACGIQLDRLRFRQHLQNEMAHYACDCWDAEIQSSYGWVECVGHADRSAYDLTSHSSATKVPLQAFVEFKEGPREVVTNTLIINKSLVGKSFNKESSIVTDHLNLLDEKGLEELEKSFNVQESVDLNINEKVYTIAKSMVSFKKEKKKVTGKNIIPGVIEPSFGIGRILYSVLEHAYAVRENDEQRAYLRIPPAIAPIKVSILPLMSKDVLLAAVPRINNLLASHGLSTKIDDTGVSIGKRYARTDEIGIPFGITIDYETLEDDTVTLRERDSTRQVRIPIEKLLVTLKDLVEGRTSWSQVESTYPRVESKE